MRTRRSRNADAPSDSGQISAGFLRVSDSAESPPEPSGSDAGSGGVPGVPAVAKLTMGGRAAGGGGRGRPRKAAAKVPDATAAGAAAAAAAAAALGVNAVATEPVRRSRSGELDGGALASYGDGFPLGNPDGGMLGELYLNSPDERPPPAAPATAPRRVRASRGSRSSDASSDDQLRLPVSVEPEPGPASSASSASRPPELSSAPEKVDNSTLLTVQDGAVRRVAKAKRSDARRGAVVGDGCEPRPPKPGERTWMSCGVLNWLRLPLKPGEGTNTIQGDFAAGLATPEQRKEFGTKGRLAEDKLVRGPFLWTKNENGDPVLQGRTWSRCDRTSIYGTAYCGVLANAPDVFGISEDLELFHILGRRNYTDAQRREDAASDDEGRRAKAARATARTGFEYRPTGTPFGCLRVGVALGVNGTIRG